MKRLLMVLFIFCSMNTAYANDAAKLRIKISGSIHNNQYFLCMTNIGCVSILAGNKGKEFPLHEGNIRNIFTTNLANLQMYTQPLPESCNINVKNNQTITVSGKLMSGPNAKVYVSELHCSVR